jgi:hypothetical protein
MGGYIFLRSASGLCDSMFMLEMLTPYAQKYNRTIIWDMMLYTASDIGSLFDFSTYPVRVLYGSKHIEKIRYRKIEPACFQSDIYATPEHRGPNLFYIDNQLAQFDMNKDFNYSVLLVYYGGIGGTITMNNIRFNKKLIDEYHSKLKLLPGKFDAIHLRATDHYDQKTNETLDTIRKFVKHRKSVYFATDNMKLMSSLSDEFPQIIKSFSYEKIDVEYKSLHKDFGVNDPLALQKALIDILICASSNEFLPSVGGFSRLILMLNKDKDLLKKIVHLKKENSDSKYSNNKSSKSTKALTIKTKFSSNGEKNSNSRCRCCRY